MINHYAELLKTAFRQMISITNSVMRTGSPLFEKKRLCDESINELLSNSDYSWLIYQRLWFLHPTSVPYS